MEDYYNSALSLQRPEKGYGAGNIKTGWVEITQPLIRRHLHE